MVAKRILICYLLVLLAVEVVIASDSTYENELYGKLPSPALEGK